MEAIRVFLKIFTIREFSHWPDIFRFHNSWKLCVCRIQTQGDKNGIRFTSPSLMHTYDLR